MNTINVLELFDLRFLSFSHHFVVCTESRREAKQASNQAREILRSSMKKSKRLEFLLNFLISLCILIPSVTASIHEYANEAFTHRSNAFFFHGGSEGLYASKIRNSSAPEPQGRPLRGKSFIRYSPFNRFLHWIFYPLLGFLIPWNFVFLIFNFDQ